MGWMILPRFQKRGLATQAAREALARATAEKKFPVVHAFPGTTNAPSNALCSRLGFERVEECDIEYQARPLRCNHWRIQLF
jgi:RimJ/RimL family protein N-acetyltransferase